MGKDGMGKDIIKKEKKYMKLNMEKVMLRIIIILLVS